MEGPGGQRTGRARRTPGPSSFSRLDPAATPFREPERPVDRLRDADAVAHLDGRAHRLLRQDDHVAPAHRLRIEVTVDAEGLREAPGPRASNRSASTPPRRRRITSSPSSGSSARSSTAPALVSRSHTRLAHQCMPYDRYTYQVPGGGVQRLVPGMPAVGEAVRCRIAVPEIGLGLHDAADGARAAAAGNEHAPDQLARDHRRPGARKTKRAAWLPVACWSLPCPSAAPHSAFFAAFARGRLGFVAAAAAGSFGAALAAFDRLLRLRRLVRPSSPGPGPSSPAPPSAAAARVGTSSSRLTPRPAAGRRDESPGGSRDASAPRSE